MRKEKNNFFTSLLSFETVRKNTKAPEHDYGEKKHVKREVLSKYTRMSYKDTLSPSLC